MARALHEPDSSYEEAELSYPRDLVKKINEDIQKRLKTQGAVRVHVAFFRCPWPCPQVTFERVGRKAIDRWLKYMEKTGWQLVSKVKTRIDKRRMAHDLRGDWYSLPLMDQVEIPVAAAFKKLDMKIERVEVPVRDEEEIWQMQNQ